ncbi:MAG: adenylate/guanylate cyclase domain-containing protein [Myxococcota bacterium]
MCIPFLVQKKAKSNLLAHFLAGNYFQCHFFLCLLWGGVEAPNMMWFTAIPIVSMLVGGLRHGVIWGLIAGLTILTFYGLEYNGNIQFRSTLTPVHQKFILSFGAVGLLAAVLGSTAAFDFLRIAAVKDRIVAEKAMDKAYQRNENLLLNMLPGTIAKRLKSHPTTIADNFNEASILFADLVGFTKLASGITPSETVVLLNHIFSLFDYAVDNYGLEKIKTIGDAYMVAGGVPTENSEHLNNVLRLAIKMMDIMETHNLFHNHDLSLRIGIATGPITAGVIGKKKFTYDVWGDTVNIASRMESTGIPGRIQVTSNVVKLAGSEFMFEPRGEMEIKGKGIMTTHLLIVG